MQYFCFLQRAILQLSIYDTQLEQLNMTLVGEIKILHDLENLSLKFCCQLLIIFSSFNIESELLYTGWLNFIIIRKRRNMFTVFC